MPTTKRRICFIRRESKKSAAEPHAVHHRIKVHSNFIEDAFSNQLSLLCSSRRLSDSDMRGRCRIKKDPHMPDQKADERMRKIRRNEAQKSQLDGKMDIVSSKTKTSRLLMSAKIAETIIFFEFSMDEIFRSIIGIIFLEYPITNFSL